MTIYPEPQNLGAKATGGYSDTDSDSIIIDRQEVKTVTLTGINFLTTATYTPICLFGDHLYETTATIVTDELITCLTPDVESPIEQTSLGVRLYLKDLGLIYSTASEFSLVLLQMPQIRKLNA